MLVVWQGARRCLSCSGQLTNQGCQLGQQRHHCGPIADKLDRYQLVDTRLTTYRDAARITEEDAALLLELRPPRRQRKFEGPRPKPITRK